MSPRGRPAALAAAGLLALAPAGAAAEPARYRIDPEHLSIAFGAGHLGYARVLGMFLKGGGGFVWDPEAGRLSDLVVTVETGSVFTNHAARDGHLRSAEFLDAGAHPEARFAMTGAEPRGPGRGVVTGDLTLRGVTRPIAVEVTLNRAGPSPLDGSERLGISARATVERARWGMTYALDQGWIPDAIPVEVELEAVREPGGAAP